jgi:hypothetical protein
MCTRALLAAVRASHYFNRYFRSCPSRPMVEYQKKQTWNQDLKVRELVPGEIESDMVSNPGSLLFNSIVHSHM